MTDASLIAVSIALWGFVGLIGAACGAGRRRGTAGFLLGLALGPAGWIIALLLPAPASTYRPRRRRL